MIVTPVKIRDLEEVSEQRSLHTPVLPTSKLNFNMEKGQGYYYNSSF